MLTSGKSRRILGIFVFCGLMLTFCFITEVVFRYIEVNARGGSCHGCWSQKKEKKYKMVGSFNTPSEQHQGVRTCSDQSICYSVDYTYDQYGRRVTPAKPISSSQHFILLGGSFAFGEGVQDTETLAHVLQTRLNGRVYNYALSGAGAPTALALFDSGKIKNEVPEKSGVAVYLACQWHVLRGDMSSRRVWSYDYPLYLPSTDGDLEYVGTPRTYYPNISSIFIWYASAEKHSAFLRFLKLNYIMQSPSHLVELMISTLSKIRDVYERDFNGKFMVMIHPLCEDKQFSYQLMAAGLRVFSPNMIDEEHEQYHVCACDNHPNALMNKWISKELIHYMHTKNSIYEIMNSAETP